MSRRQQRKAERAEAAQAAVAAMKVELAPQIAELDAKVAAGTMTPAQRDAQINAWLAMKVLAASRQAPQQAPDWLG